MIETTLTRTHSKHVLHFVDVLLLCCYGAFIYWLSAHPKLPAPTWFSWQDKIYHAGAYFIFGMLAWRCCRHYLGNTAPQLLVSLAACSLYGLSDEWHQAFVPGRSSSAADWLADTVGASLAMAALWWLPQIRSKLDLRTRFLD